MKIVFMGTPDFSVPTLEYLVSEGHKVVCVVTQPDKPRGRGKKVSFSPVKEKAIKLDIPILQPVNIKKDNNFIEYLKDLNPDVIVVIAFGQILPKEVLSIPRLGCINVHASLLPVLRGAAPINWSIINGCKETGVTTMFMDVGLDTGDMLIKEAVTIGEDETSGELHDRLMMIGASTLIKTLKLIGEGCIKRVPQDNCKSTYAPMLNKDTGRINWECNMDDIKNLVRGTNPWPGAYCTYEGSKFKIWKVEVHEVFNNESQKPGQIFKIDKKGIYVYCKDGGIILKEIQSENGKKNDAYSYTLGHHIEIGSSFK